MQNILLWTEYIILFYCYKNFFVMFLQFFCHVLAIFLSCSYNFFAMFLQFFCHVLTIFLPCSYNLSHLQITCRSASAISFISDFLSIPGVFFSQSDILHLLCHMLRQMFKQIILVSDSLTFPQLLPDFLIDCFHFFLQALGRHTPGSLP